MYLKKVITAVLFTIICIDLTAQDYNFDILTDIESQAITFIKDSDGFIWIGTLADSVYRFDGKQLKHFNSSSSLILGNNVPAIIEDKEVNIWFAASGAGLSRWNKETNKMSYYLTSNTKYIENTFFWGGKNKITEDIKGNIWIGTESNGLNRIDKKTGEITIYKTNTFSDHSIGANRIVFIEEDSFGRLWISHETKLSIFNPKTNQFTVLQQDITKIIEEPE